MPTATSNELLQSPVLKSAISKATRRLMPMLVILYVVAFLDRTNVGFAESGLQADRGVGAGAFALGAGIFFIGYAIFEIPSNLALRRFGAKVWLARIAITWGVVAACFALVQGETSFVVLRFLLGVTEAGLFPGVIMYLAAWFPNKVRVRLFAIFYLAQPFSQMIGGPLSGWLISLGDRTRRDPGLAADVPRPGSARRRRRRRRVLPADQRARRRRPSSTDEEKRALAEITSLEDAVKEETGPAGRAGRAAARQGLVLHRHLLLPAGRRLRRHLLPAPAGLPADRAEGRPGRRPARRGALVLRDHRLLPGGARGHDGPAAPRARHRALPQHRAVRLRLGLGGHQPPAGRSASSSSPSRCAASSPSGRSPGPTRRRSSPARPRRRGSG